MTWTNQRWHRRVISTLVMVVLAAPPAWAGAWTQPRDRWYVEYFYRYFYSKHTFDRDGNRVRRAKAGRFTDIRNELKLEYGITDWWNLLGSVPYLSAQFKDDTTNLLRTGVQDINLRTKFRFFNRPLIVKNNPLVASTQFSVKLPAGYDFVENPLGDGQVDFESRLQLSQAWAFAPYAARVARRTGPSLDEDGFGVTTTDTRPVSPAIAGRQVGPAVAHNRDEALRDAILLAELMQAGRERYAEQDYAEAAKWFQAVLQEQPANFEIKRIVLNHAARSMAIASLDDGPPYVLQAAAYNLEPIADDDHAAQTADRWWDTETRYAKVAFVNLEAAYTLRRGDPPNEFPLFAEAGFTPWKRLLLIGSIDASASAESTLHEESFAKWGLRGILNLRGKGFASVFRAGDGPSINLELGYNNIFAGRNTADAFELFTKLAFLF